MSLAKTITYQQNLCVQWAFTAIHKRERTDNNWAAKNATNECQNV